MKQRYHGRTEKHRYELKNASTPEKIDSDGKICVSDDDGMVRDIFI